MLYVKYFLLVSLILTFSFIIFWKFYFLRSPNRTVPEEEDIVISPADGKIIEIFEYQHNNIQLYKGNSRLKGIIKTLTGDVSENGYVVSIFMSPFDVHYNRSPIRGTVRSIKHSNGKFLAVNTFDAGLVNEKTEILIEGDIKIKMIQIAGFLARRIESSVTENEKVNAGQIVGLINLGSQVTLILPKSVMLKVNKGDRVVAGETVLAKINT